MEASVQRRIERLESKAGFELKTIVLTSACIFYAIVVFLTAAFISKASASAMESVSSSLKRYQFWNIEHQTKVDMKPSTVRSAKHVNQG